MIGCGRIGSEIADDPLAAGIQSHAEAYVASESTNLVALCDLDDGRLRRCGARWNVDALYRDPEQMVREARPDLVSICTPDATHARMAEVVVACAATKGMLVEKPLALTLEEARALVSGARRAGVVVCVNHSRRYAPSMQALKRWIDGGEIGTVRVVSGLYTRGLMHSGTHWIDLARFFVGDVVSVRATEGARGDPSDPTLDVDLTFASGARGHLIGLDERGFTVFEMDVVGDAGRLRIRNLGHAFEFERARPSPRASGYRELLAIDAPIRADLRDLTLHAVRDLVASVEGGHEPISGGRDGLAALAVCEAARASAADTGRPRTPAL